MRATPLMLCAVLQCHCSGALIAGAGDSSVGDTAVPGDALMLDAGSESSGCGPSADCGSEVAVLLAAGTPSFDPPPGMYSNPLRVAITSSTPGAEIYYTMNGDTPTTSSAKYSGTRVAFASTTTLKAIAVAPGFAASPVSVGTYVRFLGGKPSGVTFTPPGGTYASSQSVTLSSSPSSVICYSFAPDVPNCDYTAPDAEICLGAAQKYVAPVAVTPTAVGTTIRAMRCEWGFGSSDVTTATYQLP